MEEPKLDEAVFDFSQEFDYEEGAEFIKIECKAAIGIDNEEGCYYVIKTNQWSFHSLDELQQLIDRINKTIKNK
jgi:hypothetical protein